MAHIPLLQTLDSLGITPDLVVGTSMGAVLGGLYAMGYSGDTLAQIASQMNWEELLSNKIPLSAIETSERDEFDRYAVELDIYKGKLEFPLGVIEGQELGMTLSRLFYPVGDVSDFDQLPIPFRCVATDIVNGKKQVFKSGNITQAIRASMAIPTIFTPVEYEETLLVDGGVLDNFPVDIAVAEGADIIIGSDVSGGPYSKEELSGSLLNLVFQTGMIQSLRINEENQKNTDVLIDHLPHLTYTTGEFNQARAIIEQGRQAVLDNMEALISLEGQSKAKQADLSHQNTITLSDIHIEGVKPEIQELMIRKMELDPYELYTLDEVEASIRNMYGTRLFKKLDYQIIGTGEAKTLKISTSEKRHHSFKTALHYDSDRGAGILLNLTSRNLIGPGSRMLATVDAAENPAIRLQVQKPIGVKGKWWTRLEYRSEKVLQQYYIEDRLTEDFFYNYRSGVWQLNKELSITDYIGGGVKAEFNQLKPKLTAADKGISPDSTTTEINQLRNDNFGVYLRYEHNSYNRRFFPTAGSFVLFDIQYNLRNQIDVNYYSNVVQGFNEQVASNIKLELDYEQVFPLTSQSQLITRLYLGHNFKMEAENTLDFYCYGLMQYFFLGGLEQRRDNYFIPFAGLQVGEIPASQVSSVNLMWQWSFLPNTYFTPAINVAIYGQKSHSDFYEGLRRLDQFGESNNPKLVNAEWLQSLSASLGYMSVLGPIQLEASILNFEDFRIYFSLGFFF